MGAATGPSFGAGVEATEKRAEGAQLARRSALEPYRMNWTDSAAHGSWRKSSPGHIAGEYGLAVDMSIHAPSKEGRRPA